MLDAKKIKDGVKRFVIGVPCLMILPYAWIIHDIRTKKDKKNNKKETKLEVTEKWIDINMLDKNTQEKIRKIYNAKNGIA